MSRTASTVASGKARLAMMKPVKAPMSTNDDVEHDCSARLLSRPVHTASQKQMASGTNEELARGLTVR